MSTSLLYHAFNIVGYVHRRTEFVGREIIFKIEQAAGRLRCSACQCRDVIRRGVTDRQFRAPGIGFKRVIIELPVQRVECRECGLVRQVRIPFAEENQRYIRQFERYALELSHHMTIKGVAHHLVVSWDVIKDTQKRYLKRKYSKPGLRDLGGPWTQVSDGSLGPQQRSSGLCRRWERCGGSGPFWKRLKASRAKVQAVAMDMSKAYISAVTAHLTESTIVFDHFHLIKLFNEKLTQLRRDLHRELEDCLDKDVLKGTRWLVLKNPENLDPDRNERERLEEALRLNEPLATAYYMKEDLRPFWIQDTKKAAELHLNDWIARAEASGIAIQKTFATTLRTYRSGILAYYDYRISSGPLEGTNNKIKTMQRQAVLHAQNLCPTRDEVRTCRMNLNK
jgi:transposase